MHDQLHGLSSWQRLWLRLPTMRLAVFHVGAKLARGCTSGQALTGGALLSAGGWAFMMMVFAGGYGAAWMVRRQWQ